MARRRRANVDIIYEDDVTTEEQQEEKHEVLEDTQDTIASFTAEPEAIPETVTVEEVEATVEDAEGTQIFQSYQQEDEVEPLADLEPIDAEITEELTEPEAPSSEIILLDYFPSTPEEYEKGFRRLSPKEKKAWGVPPEEEYDTIPGLAHSLGVARNTIESWIYQCLEEFPSGFLKTRNGLTAECFVIMQSYRNYCGGENYTKTRKTRFLKKLGEQQEQYLIHIQAYKEKQIEAQEEKVRAELNERSTALTHSPSVVEGEFVDEQTQLQIQVSFERSDRRRDVGIEDYVLGRAAQSISETYKKVAQLKPLMDEAIQNGLTGKDLPDLSKIYTKE